jgi:acyl carrier protein
MATAEEILAFTTRSLEEMNLEIVSTDPEVMLGPSGLDLDSLAVAELAARLEDSYGLIFPEGEIEQLAIMTLGEFAEMVATQALQAQPEGAPG